MGGAEAASSAALRSTRFPGIRIRPTWTPSPPAPGSRPKKPRYTYESMRRLPRTVRAFPLRQHLQTLSFVLRRRSRRSTARHWRRWRIRLRRLPPLPRRLPLVARRLARTVPSPSSLWTHQWLMRVPRWLLPLPRQLPLVTRRLILGSARHVVTSSLPRRSWVPSLTPWCSHSRTSF